MGDLFRQSGSLIPGQTNVDAADFHALVDGLILKSEVIIGKPFLPSAGAPAANLLVYDPLTNSLRRATISTLLESAVGINASGITSGQLAAARLTDNSIPLSKLANFTIEALRDAGALTGVLSPDRIPNTSLGIEKLNPGAVESLRDATQLTGTLAPARIEDDSLPGAKLEDDSVPKEKISGAGNLAFASYFESDEEPLPPTAGSSTEVAHGLGGIPLLVQVEMVCKNAAFGWSPGDRAIVVETTVSGYGSYAVYTNTTKIGLQRIATIYLLRRDGANQHFAPAAADWRLIFKAWR